VQCAALIAPYESKATGDIMKLYGFFNSSTSCRVRIALAPKGVSHEYAGVNLRAGEQGGQD
jgi:glutathione S-transferase